MDSIVGKVMRPFAAVWRVIALTLVICATGGAWAEAITKANPVTGETETYTWRYVDTTHNTWNSTGNWQDENSAFATAVPQLGNNYDAFLVDGDYDISSGSAVNGWTLRCGAYGGADITFTSLNKLQNGAQNSTDAVWLTADSSSSITITTFNGNQLEHATGVFKLTSAKAGGITWSAGLTGTSTGESDRIPIHYYIDASGDISTTAAVVYGGALSISSHVIKRVNVTLAHPVAKTMVEKKLVSFTSTTKTFTTADDSVVYVDSAPFYFTAGDLPTTQSLTVGYGVGTCELVQKSDGVYLYYVDGPAPQSVNINSCQGGENTYKVDEAQPTLIGSIPTGAWGQSTVNGNGTITVASKYDGTSVTALDTSVSAEESVNMMSNHGQDTHQGGTEYTLDILRSWLATKDNTSHSGTMTISNIPFDYYDVIIIMSGHSGNAGHDGKFAPLTITAGNKAATQYTGASTGIYKTTTGSGDWGTRGKNRVAYGENALRVDGLSGNLTISYDAYGEGIAAVQIVEHTSATCTWSPNGENWGYLVDNTQSNWDIVPMAGDNIELDVSADATLYVNGDLSLNNVTIVNSSTSATAENPVILTINKSMDCTLTANQVNVPANVQLKVTTASTSGTPTLNAPVALASDSSLYIDISCTWATAISGSGKVIVAGKELANSSLSTATVTFTAASSYTGGLTVKAGGLAKTTVAASTGGGFGGSGTNPHVGNITVEDGGAVDLAKCYSKSCYALTLAGTGINNSGAAFCSEEITNVESQRQVTSIILNGDATIVCDNAWGLLASDYGATTMTLNSYKLCAKGSSYFIMCNTTFNGSSGIDVYGTVKTVNTASVRGNTAPTITVKNGGTLNVSGANLTTVHAVCESGGVVNVAANKTLDIKNSLTVGGTVNVNGTLTMASGTTITKTSDTDGVINIGPAGIVDWGSVWNSTAGDIFRGTGTLFLDGTGSSRITHLPRGTAFSGILKIGSSCTDGVYLDGNPEEQFTGTPELILARGTEADQKEFWFGNSAIGKYMKVRDLSGYAKVVPWCGNNGACGIESLQTKNTAFAGIFTDYDPSTNQKKTTLTVKGADDATSIYSLTLSGANTTTGPLVVTNNAEVIFPSTGGSWKNGAVSVGENGYLEAQHNDALGTVTFGNNSHVVIPKVSDAAVPLTATTINIPAQGSSDRVYVDLTALGLTTSSESLTVMSGTAVGDVANLRSVGCSGSFTYANNVVTFTPGVTTWTGGSATWSAGDITGTTSSDAYSESGDITFGAIASTPATITLDGERTPADVTFNGGSDTTYVLTGANGSFKPTGTVTISSGTLSIACDATLQTVTGSGTLDIAAGATVTIASADALNGISNLTGSGTLVLSGAVPSSTLQTFLKDYDWLGTMWIKNITGGSANGFNPNNYGHGAGADYVASTVKVTGLTGYLPEGVEGDSYILTVLPTLELADEGDTVALTLNDGYSYSHGNYYHYPYTKLTKLSGTGTFKGTRSQGNQVLVQVLDWDDFNGNIDLSDSSKCLYFGSADPSDLKESDDLKGCVYIATGATVSVPDGAVWKAATSGFIVDGALTCDGGIMYGTAAGGSLALKGSGVITNRFEGGSAQCFNAGAITVSGSLSVVLVGGWSSFGTWTLTDTASLGFDPGTDAEFGLSGSDIAAAGKDNTIHVYGDGSHIVYAYESDATKDAAIHVHNGGIFQVGENNTNDYLGYDGKDSVGQVVVDAGGELRLRSRETYTRNTVLNGGTINLAGVQSDRSIDIYGGQTIMVNENSLIESTVTGNHWIYLRNSNPTFNVAANKTLTVNAGFTYDASDSKQDLIKSGAGTMVVNGYTGGGEHESFSQPKGVNIQAGTYELNAVQTKSGTGNDIYNVASGAKLKVGATGQVNTTTMTLTDGSLLEFGANNATLINADTVTFTSGEVAVSLSDGITPANGTKLISWTTAPEGGSFTLTGYPLYHVVSESDGLYLMRKPGTIFSVY